MKFYLALFFFEDIEMEVDANSKDNTTEYLHQIINSDQSRYDEVVSISFSTRNIGSQTGSVRVSLKGVVREYFFKYTIVDTIAPIITVKEPVITKVGYPLVLDDYIKVTDSSVKEDVVYGYTVDGEIDWNFPGEYLITVKAVDSSGNKSEYVFIVYVEDNYIDPVEYTDFSESEESDYVETEIEERTDIEQEDPGDEVIENEVVENETTENIEDNDATDENLE